MPPFTIREKIQELQRELRMRRQVYARRVQAGQMTQSEADRKTNLLEEILKDYESQERKTGGDQATLI